MSNVIVVGNGAASIAMVLRLVQEGHKSILWYGGASIRQEITGRTVEGKPYGIAYRTSNPRHRLNAEAKAMSIPGAAWTFPQYLAEQGWAEKPSQAEKLFAPRHEYRGYLRKMLMMAWSDVDNVTNFWPEATLENIQDVEAEGQIILCVGATHKHNSKLPEGTIQNPWDFDYTRLVGAKSILIYGSGLTALDTAISAWEVNTDLHVDFVSRSGRFPLLWKDVPPAKEWLHGPVNLNDIRVRDVIKSMRSRVVDGADWQALFNGARHQWKHVWGLLSEKERSRFFKVQPFWEIHRHKMIPETAQILREHSYFLGKLGSENLHASLREPAFRFNATGVDTNPIMNPLLTDMYRKRLIDLAPQAHLGLRAFPDCKVGHRIWCVGAHMRAARWEATAMADIVDMVDIVAKQLEK